MDFQQHTILQASVIFQNFLTMLQQQPACISQQDLVPHSLKKACLVHRLQFLNMYHRDGQMRVDGNHGSTLGYEPNSYGEWQHQTEQVARLRVVI